MFEGAARRELPAVAERYVVRDEHGDAALERRLGHRLPDGLLDVLRRAAREPDGVPLRHHRGEPESAAQVSRLEEIDGLLHCPRVGRGHEEPRRRGEGPPGSLRARRGGGRQCPDKDSGDDGP